MSVIDTDTIDYLRSLSADASFLNNLIDAFVRDVQEEIPQMRLAFEQKKMDLLKHLAHKHKSSSRNLGATKLTALCLDVEYMVREGNGTLPIVVKKIQAIEDEAKQAVAELLTLSNKHL